ncbi:hypothetical protein QBC34DRAFT_373680 [Podospora aff. communis PSN243]|uniref:Uncharacterized protein n=1 Tax=Podospora aff. communis PSN243 TaxID=3040156 RepID=A0AAV9H5W8_9PEZI|nr:hypothetical protein QBC34DRAFT_373680 [Podospora aff. communis PSN243]
MGFSIFGADGLATAQSWSFASIADDLDQEVQHDENQTESSKEGLLTGRTLVGSSTLEHPDPGQKSPTETQSTSPTTPPEETSVTATNEGATLGVHSDSSDSDDNNDVSAIIREQARRKAIKKGKQPVSAPGESAALRTRGEVYKLGYQEGSVKDRFWFPNFVAESDERQRSFDERKRKLEAEKNDAAAEDALLSRERPGSRKRPLDLDEEANDPKTSRPNGGRRGKSDVRVSGTGKRRKTTAHQARPDKRKVERSRRRDKSSAEVGTLHTGLTPGNLLRLEELEALGELSAVKERSGSHSHRRSEKDHGEEKAVATEGESRRHRHQHGNPSSERSSQQKPTERKKMDKEIPNAIFYNPTTAGPKAREEISRLRATAIEAPKNNRISDIQREAKAFRGLDAAMAQGKEKETKAIPKQKTAPASTHKASHTRRKQRSPEEAQKSEDPEQPEEQQELPRPALRRGLPVQQVLDANQVFRQWVVWRTPKFMPQGCEQNQDKARRGPEYQSKPDANAQARAQLERLQKGVAGKTWNHGPETKALEREGLFSGHVTFEGGHVQYFWVEEELVDLSMVVKSRKAAGKADILVDPTAAKVYQRKRYDVVSYHIYAVGKEERERPETLEASKERRALQSQTVVIDCSGDGEEGDQDDEGVDVTDKVGSRTKTTETRKLLEILYQSEDSESESESESGSGSESQSGSGSISVPMPPPALHHTSKGSDDADDEASRSLNPLHLTRPRLAIQGSFTTMELANRAAIRIFLNLIKPTDDQPAEDKHYYKYYIRPHYFQLGRDMISHEAYKTAPVEIIFDSDLTKYKWGFLRLVVEVVESELKGPIDISDMLAQELMTAEEAVQRNDTSPTPPDTSQGEALPVVQANNTLPAQAVDTVATADPPSPAVRKNSVFNITLPWADIDSNASEEG